MTGTVEPDVGTKVDEIINGGGVLQHFTDTAGRCVVGNRLAIKLLVLICFQRGLRNGRGVYAQVNGDAGGGKTHTVRQVLWLMPPEIVEDGSMSAQAIFYDGATEPKIYYIDDFNALDENLKASLKVVLTNFRRPTTRKSVEKVAGGVNMATNKTVPPRTVLIFSSVDSIGDQQLMSRLVPLPVDGDEDVKRQIHDFQVSLAVGEVPDLDAVEDERVQVCREIMRALTEKPLEVIIPYGREIVWPEVEFKQTRNFDVFLDLIKLCAILEQRNREQDDQGRLRANYDDFYTAATIYAPRRAMQAEKLSEGPQKVLNYLRDHRADNFTQAELVKNLKVNQGNLSRWLKTLQEMSMVVEDNNVRDITIEKTMRGDDGKDYEYTDHRTVNAKVYQYKGDITRGNLYDTPLQLSDAEREKPQYRGWAEKKAEAI